MKKSFAYSMIVIAVSAALTSTSQAQRGPFAFRHKMMQQTAQQNHGWGRSGATQTSHINETQAGTYRDNLSAGAQAQANLYRGRVAGNVQSNAVRLGGRDFLSGRASGHVEGRIGSNAGAQGGVNFGPNPTIGGQAAAFAGQEVTTAGVARGNLAGYRAGVSGNAQAGQGLYGNAQATLGHQGLAANAGGFVGNRASATGGFDVSGVGGSGTAEAWNGLGAEAGLNTTYDAGKLRLKGKLGAALGLGGKLEADVTIDTNEVRRGAENFADATTQLYNQVAPEVERGFNTAGREIETSFNTAGREIETSFNTAGREIERGATSVGREIESGFNSIGSFLGL